MGCYALGTVFLELQMHFVFVCCVSCPELHIGVVLVTVALEWMKSEKRCLICKSAWVRKELLTEPTNILKSVSIAISDISSLSVLPYFVPATLKEKLRWHESSICGDIRQHFRPWFSDFSPFSLFSHFFLFLIIFTLFSVQSDEDYQPSLFPLYPLCRPLVHIVHLVLLQTQRRPHSISMQKTASIALLWTSVKHSWQHSWRCISAAATDLLKFHSACRLLFNAMEMLSWRQCSW